MNSLFFHFWKLSFLLEKNHTVTGDTMTAQISMQTCKGLENKNLNCNQMPTQMFVLKVNILLEIATKISN